MLRARQSRSVLDWFKRLLFPVYCLGCGSESDWICPQCLKQLEIMSDRRCAICKKAAIGGLCPKCRKLTQLDGVIAPLDYQNPLIKQVLSTAKYDGGWDAITCLSAALHEEIIRRLPEGDWHYAYIPQTKQRSAKRGYNQSEIFTKLLANERIFLGIKKIRETAAQATLTKAERKTNLKDAFKIVDKPPEEIVLCDDVITTGSTLSAVVRPLRKAGAKRIWAVTLAHD